MKKTAALLCLSLSLLVPNEAALAKGCIKGAIIGGVLGHYVGRHGTLGAIAGCVYGRHEAAKSQRRAAPRSPLDRPNGGFI